MSFAIKTLSCIAMFFLSLWPAFAIQWEQLIDKSSIQVYVSDFPGSDLKQFKGEVLLASSIDSVVALFSDQSSCVKWLYQCEDSLEIDQVSFGERFIYHVNGVHSFADSRDYILHTKIYREVSSGVITIELKAVPNYCKDRTTSICFRVNQFDYIRVTKLTGRYKLIPMSENRVKVIWTQHIEPGGRLPDFIVNRLLKKIPYESLKRMRELVLGHPYNTALLKFDATGQVSGISIR